MSSERRGWGSKRLFGQRSNRPRRVHSGRGIAPTVVEGKDLTADRDMLSKDRRGIEARWAWNVGISDEGEENGDIVFIVVGDVAQRPSTPWPPIVDNVVDHLGGGSGL